MRWIEPLVSFVVDVATVCDFFSPMINPRDLCFLIHVRWTTEPPRAWYENWPPRRPQTWLDSALKNERWERSLAKLRDELFGR